MTDVVLFINACFPQFWRSILPQNYWSITLSMLQRAVTNALGALSKNQQEPGWCPMIFKKFGVIWPRAWAKLARRCQVCASVGAGLAHTSMYIISNSQACYGNNSSKAYLERHSWSIVVLRRLYDMLRGALVNALPLTLSDCLNKGSCRGCSKQHSVGAWLCSKAHLLLHQQQQCCIACILCSNLLSRRRNEM